MATKGKCQLCDTSEAMKDDLFCGYCSESLEKLWDLGWAIVPPKIHETQTRLASIYRRYGTKPSKSHVRELPDETD